MKGINFDHNSRRISDSVGVSEDRWDELTDAVMKGLLNKKSFSTMSERLEYVIKKAEPENAAEYFLLGMIFARGLDGVDKFFKEHKPKIKSMAKRVLEMLADEEDEDDEEE